MKKYLIILLLLTFALLTSCNLDNQGIFAEVLDRVPSDNRKLSFIGEVKDSNNEDSKIVYFKSVKGIESYEFKKENTNDNPYSTIDWSENSRKNNVFVFNKTDKEIIYFVDKATSDSVSYDSCYKLDLNNNTTTKLSINDNSNSIFVGSYNEYLIGKDGKIYSYTITGTTINITFVAEVTGEYYFKNIDNIFAFSTKSGDVAPQNLKYYKFTGTGFTELTRPDGVSSLGLLRSVSDDGKYLIFSEVNGQTGTFAFELEETKYEDETKYELKKLSTKLSSSNIGKDFESFVDNGCLYFAFDGSNIFNKYNLSNNELTTTTISKLANVAIVGYFKVGPKNYKICTANNGFFNLSLEGTPHLT